MCARARKRRAGALIVPQNGAQLVTERGFLQTISGIAVEDTFTDGDERQDPDHSREILTRVAKVRAKKKPVLAVEYAEKASLRALATRSARKHGLVLLVTDRALKTLGR